MMQGSRYLPDKAAILLLKAGCLIAAVLWSHVFCFVKLFYTGQETIAQEHGTTHGNVQSRRCLVPTSLTKTLHISLDVVSHCCAK